VPTNRLPVTAERTCWCTVPALEMPAISRLAAATVESMAAARRVRGFTGVSPMRVEEGGCCWLRHPGGSNRRLGHRVYLATAVTFKDDP
jgi:hypothetical protein